MKGQRVDADDQGYLSLGHGDYGKDANGNWYSMPPNFKGGYANLSKHVVVEHGDGSITVSPSIKIENHLNMWHGYLKRGIWEVIEYKTKSVDSRTK